jgi:beta-galactosidase
VNLPHDFVVEGNFSQSGDLNHGYLPVAIGWYRKHIHFPDKLASCPTIFIDFEGIQTKSQIWLNGIAVAEWNYGYTGQRLFLNSSIVTFGSENVLVVRVDATQPDGWWYDGGGIYRHVVLTAVESPGPVIAPWGVYAAGSRVTGNISWDSQGNPSADAVLLPSVEVWNNGSTALNFSVTLLVFGPHGRVVATTSGSGSVGGKGGVVLWSPPSALVLSSASLWHTVKPPSKPALYVLATQLSVHGSIVDSTNVTFGIRSTRWDGETGFWLNGRNIKILGNANHQDFAGTTHSCVSAAHLVESSLAPGRFPKSEVYSQVLGSPCPTTCNGIGFRSSWTSAAMDGGLRTTRQRCGPTPTAASFAAHAQPISAVSAHIRAHHNE